MRLDIFLQIELNQSRSQVSNFIKKIGVKVNDKVTNKSGYKLRCDDVVSYELLKHEPNIQYHVDFDIDIIYEDDSLLIVNKPPFLTVHPAPSVKEATLVEWLKSKNITLSNISGEERAGIVHRIDKQTSGALVITKNNDSHTKLSSQLEDKSMGRYYIAIIDTPLKEDITIERSISRNPKNRLKMLASTTGKYAKSSFAKLITSHDNRYELIAIKLHTGRTHQIRAHLESISRHILGDYTYGFKSKKDKIIRVMLHAYTIYFTHPKNGKDILHSAPLFEDMQNLLQKHFDKKELDEKLTTDYIMDCFSTPT